MKIVTDSSCDLTNDMIKDMNISIVPLTLEVDNKFYVDDDKLDILKYLEAMKNASSTPKSACPSPQDFINNYKCDDNDIFAVTISSELSGSYNSAELGKSLYLEDAPHKNIFVFNSKCASAGQTLIALKLHELIKNNFSFDQIVTSTNKYIEELKTIFLLDNVGHLAKNGRLKHIAAKLVTVLNLKFILWAKDDGSIGYIDQARGYKKAFTKFVNSIGKEGKNLEDKVLAISHCNCLDRALAFKEAAMKKYNFKEIIIVQTKGLSSTYADQGGLVIAF